MVLPAPSVGQYHQADIRVQVPHVVPKNNNIGEYNKMIILLQQKLDITRTGAPVRVRQGEPSI